MAAESSKSHKNKREYDRESYILVVDDDQTLLKFFKIHLNKFFSRVIVVKSAEEALKTIETKQIDLVMSDIRMPGFDGISLLRKIRTLRPEIPLLLVSGALMDEKEQRVVAEVSDGFLSKPFSVEEIHQFIDRGLALRKNATKA